MPHRKALNKLGELEQAVMQQIWEHSGPVSVREVHEGLAPVRDLAYTTVMTVMVRLADSGVLQRHRQGRAYVYTAADSREQLTAQTMHEQLEPLGSDDRRAALLHFVDAASPDDLADLRAALAEVERRATAAPDGDAGSSGSGRRGRSR